jgi:flagellar hook-basal body complex protein FliE
MAVTFNHAASAYTNAASRVAERIVSDVEHNTAKAIPGDYAPKTSFSELMAGSLDQARDANYKGEMTSTKSIANEAELHDLITSVSNAELTLNTVVAVRDRMISAYQDIIKMAI